MRNVVSASARDPNVAGLRRGGGRRRRSRAGSRPPRPARLPGRRSAGRGTRHPRPRRGTGGSRGRRSRAGAWPVVAVCVIAGFCAGAGARCHRRRSRSTSSFDDQSGSESVTMDLDPGWRRVRGESAMGSSMVRYKVRPDTRGARAKPSSGPSTRSSAGRGPMGSTDGTFKAPRWCSFMHVALRHRSPGRIGRTWLRSLKAFTAEIESLKLRRAAWPRRSPASVPDEDVIAGSAIADAGLRRWSPSAFAHSTGSVRSPSPGWWSHLRSPNSPIWQPACWSAASSTRSPRPPPSSRSSSLALKLATDRIRGRGRRDLATGNGPAWRGSCS